MRTGHREWRSRALLVALSLAVACSTQVVAPTGTTPPGADVLAPFPIDRGDDGAGTPGTYKGLWLRLVDRGEPAVTPADGALGVVCIGMSNANQECGDFIGRVESEWAAEIDPAVRVVNCAVGGHAIERWIDPEFDDRLWRACIETRLPAAGVRPDQVRVIYHKAANQYTVAPDGSPLPLYPAAASDYANFLDHLDAFAARVPVWFPSVQAVYTSSRSYGGFANNARRGEPLSYEEGHALNEWLRSRGTGGGVWYGWGPYLWAPDCASGVTNAGDVCYEREDYVTDGVHPAASGRAKMSRLLHERLLRHEWYRR